MTSVLVAVTKRMIIIRMVLAVRNLIVPVWDLKQLSYNMVHNSLFVPDQVLNFTFFKVYLNTLKKP